MNRLNKLSYLIVVFLLVSCSKRDWTDSEVANEFVFAIVEADLEKAKSLTDSTQWNKLEELIDSRVPLDCVNISWDWIILTGSGGLDEEENEWNYSRIYSCEKPLHCLKVNDIKVGLTETGWRITGWGSICEASKYSYVCSELCRTK